MSTASAADDPLKRRLVGAIVLVGMAVILLSLLLNGSGEPDLETPAGPQFVIVGAQAPQTQSAAPDVVPDSSTERAVEEVVAPERAPTPAPEPVSEPTQAHTTASRPAADPEPTVQATPQRETRAVSQPAPRRTSANGPSGWYVQVGVFSSQENASRLAAELQRRTYTVRQDRIALDGQARHRVMVGPYPNEAQAKRRQPMLQRAINESGRVRFFD